MNPIRTWLRVLVSACFGLVLLQGNRAWAATFEVSPVRMSLSQAAPNGLLAVHNQSAEPLRFQVTAFTWAQGTDGEMILAPTEELVVFPTVFSLKAGETRNLRVGGAAPAGASEKTFRIFVEELPPLQTPAASNAVRVLTRMGIPVFVSPKGGAPAPRVDGIAEQGSQIAFTLRNTGSAFFVARKVVVKGIAADGSTVFTRETAGWYMLAGGVRNYTLELPAEACKAARVEVEVETETTKARASAELTKRACPR